MDPITDLTLDGLTTRINASSKVISECISQNNFPELTFETDGPANFPIPPQLADAQIARQQLIEAAGLIERLVRGPNEASSVKAAAHQDTANLRTLYRFDAFAAVPIDGDATYSEIAKRIGLDEGRTKRLMQYGMTNGFFEETNTGHVKHSAQSAAIARDEKQKAMIGLQCEDLYPAASRYTDWLSTHPIDNGEPTEAGYPLAFNTDKTFFEYMTDVEPMRHERFGRAMSSLSERGGIFDSAYVLGAFDWSSLAEKATVVDVGVLLQSVLDLLHILVISSFEEGFLEFANNAEYKTFQVGGGRGHICVLIADVVPRLHFLVQDYAETVCAGRQALSPELAGRIDFMAHDFLKPQPADLSPRRGPLVFFLRFVLHDWPDKYCVKILRNLIPVMKEGSTILINEMVLPPFGTTNRAVEKFGKVLDMQMLTTMNSRERTEQEFKDLFEAADVRLKLRKTHRAPGSPVAIMEVAFS